MARRIQLRRDTAAAWSATNPTLAQGEIGIDLTSNKIKIGTGTTPWNSLAYWDDKVTDLSDFAGHIIPAADNTYDLGSPTRQWRDIFVSNGSIYIGDIKISNDAGQLMVQQVTDPGEETEAPVPDAPGSVTTDRLVHGSEEVTLEANGNLLLPNGGRIIGGSIYTETMSIIPNIEKDTQIGIISQDENEQVAIGTSGGLWQFMGNGTMYIPGTITKGDNLTLNSLGAESSYVAAVIADGDAGRVMLRTDNGETTKTWEFDVNGDLTLPAGGDIVDSNGDSVLGSGVASLTDDKEVKITVGNTEYWAIVNRANNNDGGVEASAVAYDSDDNMITLHTSDGSSDTISDRLIISKFDSSANLLWQKQIENDIDTSVAHDVAIDADDNIIVAASMDNSYPVDSIVVMKFTSGGSLVWQKDYQSSVITENIEEVSINTTVGSGTFQSNPAQTVIVFGQFSLLAAGWTFQSSPDSSNWTTLGTVLGSTYDNNSNETTVFFAPATFGGNLDGNLSYRLVGDGVNTWQEVGGMVLQGNNIFIGGQYEDNNNGNEYKGLLMKISATDGTLAWSKTFDYGADTRVWGMDVGADGNIVVVGQADGIPVSAAFAAKFSGSTGAHIWSKVLFEPLTGKEYSGADLVIDSGNNIFVSVNSREAIVHEAGNDTTVTVAHLMKLNSSGAVQWMRRVGPGPCASVSTGIDRDSLGNIYLSALTVTQKNPGRDYDDFAINTTRNVLVIAKYNTSGTVLWQRYLEADGYYFAGSSSDGTEPGSFDGDGVNRGRLLSLNNSGKLAVQVTAKHVDLDYYTPNTEYYESITFQIDQDGREMTIGSGQEKFTVKESRIPGKFVTAPVYEPMGPVEAIVYDLTADVVVTDPEHSITEGILAQHIFKSAPYEYVFGNDGTLTIPNDGDIKLVQTQIGWFSIFGPANNNTADVDIRCNVVDPSTGDVYVAGESDDYNQGWVARYNSQGQILWSIRLYDQDADNSNRCNAIKLNPVTGNVVVLCEYYGNYNKVLLVEIDPDTARVVNTAGFGDQNNDNNVTAYDFDYFSNGDVAVVGRKYDEFNSISVTPQTGSTTSTLIILNSATASNAVHPVTNSWYVTGTGITGRAGIQYVNRYTGVTGTTRAGTGATFNVVANDGDPGIYTFTLASAGTNYRAGHKIKILGSALGGVDGVNDLIITVIDVNEGGDIDSISPTPDGTSAGSNPTTYNGVSGTAHQLGSGLTFTFDGDDNGTYTEHNYVITAGGTNYVAGDVIVIPGTQLGGTSPANNLTAVVSTVTTGAVDGFASFSGTQQTTTRRITISDAVDFGGAGSWSVVHELGGEAFVVRYPAGEGSIVWSKVLSAGGQYDTERYLSVAVDSSDNVYAAGEMVSRNNAAGSDLNSYWCAAVTKLNSSGTHQWTKALNTTLTDSYAKCVAVRGSTLAVSHNNDNNEAFVTKLDTSGNIKWQRRTYTNGGDSSVAIDANGDIYAVIESNVETAYEDVINIVRFATNGEVIYHKFLGTLVQQGDNSDERFKNGRNLTLDADYMYISGYTSAFASNQNNGFLVKLPKAGDCDGNYGVWSVQTDAYDVDLVESTEAAAFTPVINTGNWATWSPDFTPIWWDPSDNSSYHTFQEIRDRDGGAIEFADGTRQTSSAQQIPQRKISNGADHRLTLEDMGKHIYVTNDNTTINIPYHYDNPLPIGFTVVIVNDSGGTVSIDADGGNLVVIVPGVSTGQYYDLSNLGMATLLKVDESRWFLTGNVTDDN